MTLTLFGGGLFFLAGDFLELYFGPAYREGAQALQILIIGAYLFGLARAFIPILQAIGRIKKTETVTVICLLINILLNIYLIPVYGINGAAIATGISYGLMIFGVLYLWRNTPYTLMNDLNIIKLGSGSFIFIISYGTISYYVRLSPLLSIIVLSLIGLVIFIIIFTLNGEIPYRKYKIY